MIRHLSLLILIVLFSRPVFGETQREIQTRLDTAERLYETRDIAGHADLAIEAYQEILRIRSKDAFVLWKLSRSYRWRGDQLAQKTKRLAAYKIAEEYAKAAISENTESVGGHLMLGIAYGRIGETQGLLKSFFLITPIKNEMAHVLELDPENDVAYHVLSILYRKIPGWMGGSHKKSVSLLNKAIRKNPNRTSHYLELAHSYLRQKKKSEAIHSLHTLLKIKKPEDRVRAASDRADAEALLKTLNTAHAQP